MQQELLKVQSLTARFGGLTAVDSVDFAVAEADPADKNRVSHRGKALGELKEEFDKVMTWIRQNMPVQEKFIYQDEE